MESEEFDVAEEEFAVIGMAGRFPGAPDLETFWENLRQGRDTISRFRPEELDRSQRKLAIRTEYVSAKPMLADVELFDADFFGYTGRQAELADPQQRLFLECAHEALENAGYNPRKTGLVTGLFGGASLSTYYLYHVRPEPEGERPLEELAGLLGNDKDYLATSVAYRLNLKGPAMSVQTACSTSLVALHLACRSLAEGECDMALAGGVTVRMPRKKGYLYSKEGILSPDGHCRPFDAEAGGTLFGDGVGLVVVKRLADALEAGDRIDAVVLGTAVNNDGARKAGFTAPGAEGQARVIAEAQAMAGVSPEQIGYIEAHGTGTALGDPVETAALSRVFRRRTEKKEYCALGSVKANCGHMESAAGVAGFIKTVLMLKKGELPPQPGFKQGNPQCDFEKSPFYVNTKLRPWEGPERIAGVSSFGMGGTNAHVILKAAPASVSAPPAASVDRLFCLSAKSETALAALEHKTIKFLKENPQLSMRDLAYTMGVGREHYAFRLACVARDLPQLLEKLSDEDAYAQVNPEAPPEIRVFLPELPARPLKTLGGLRDVYKGSPAFVQALAHCEKAQGGSIKYQEIFQRETRSPVAGDESSWYFVLCYALIEHWKSLGLTPAAYLGEGLGVITAGFLSGANPLATALESARNYNARQTTGTSRPAESTGAELIINPEQTDMGTLCQEAARLYKLGFMPDFAGFFVGENTRRLELPTYAFQKQVYWLNSKSEEEQHPFFNAETEAKISQELQPFLRDHVVRGATVLPGMAYLELLLEFAEGAGENAPLEIFAPALTSPIILEGAPVTLRLESKAGEIMLYAREAAGGNWIPQMEGSAKVRSLDPEQLREARQTEPRPEVTYQKELSRGAFYELMNAGHNHWGSAFQGLERVQLAEKNARAQIKLPAEIKIDFGDYHLHPAISDLAGQLLGALSVLKSGTPFKAALVGESIQRTLYFGPLSGEGLEIQATLQEESAERVVGDVSLLDDSGQERVRFEGMALRILNSNFAISREQYRRVLRPLELKNSGAPLFSGKGELLIVGEGEMARALEKAALERGLSPQILSKALGPLPEVQELIFAPQTEREPAQLIFELNQVLSQIGERDKPEFYLITKPDLGGAALQGAGRSLLLEQPELRPRLVELDEPEDAPALFATPAPGSAENQLRFRDGLYFAPRLVRHARRPQTEAAKLDGTWLLTGGMGALGLSLAAWLLEQGVKELILLGRTEREAAVQALGQDGVSIKTLVLDLAEPGALKAALENETLQGVVHLAGLHGRRALGESSLEEIETLLGPKVAGTQELFAALEGQGLQHLVLFSSASAYLSSPLLSTYAAANSALEALAREGRKAGLPVSALAWGPFPGVGMAADYSGEGPLGPLKPETAWEMLGELLSGPREDVLVLPCDWSKAAQIPAFAEDSFLSELISRPDVKVPGRSGHGNAVGLEQPPRNQAEIQEYLGEQTALLLGRTPADIPADAPLAGLGMDSMNAVELRNRVERIMGVSPPMAYFLQAPGTGALAQELERLLKNSDVKAVRSRAVASDVPTYGEKALWAVYSMAPENAAYNVGYAAGLGRNLDRPALARALGRLLERHPVLNSRFVQQDGELRRLVAASAPVALEIQVYKNETELEQLLGEEYRRAFVLEEGPLQRTKLFESPQGEINMLFVVHHIVADFASLLILLEELGRLYGAELGKNVEPPAVPYNRDDYGVLLTELLESPAGQRMEEYWLQKLGGETPLLDLPFAAPRPVTRSFKGAAHLFEIPPEVAGELGELARKESVTLFTLLLTLYQTLLHRYTGGEDIIVGAPVAGRFQGELAGVVGQLMNMTALRLDFSGMLSLRELLASSKETVLEALEHQAYPFQLLLEKLNPPRDLSRTPVFQTAFALHTPGEQNDLFQSALGLEGVRVRAGELELESRAFQRKVSRYDLDLMIFESERGLLGSLEYDTALFTAQDMEAFVAAFQRLLLDVTANPGKRVGEYSFVSETEQSFVLESARGPRLELPAGQTLPALIDETAARTPERIAVQVGESSLSYGTLQKRAGEISTLLVDKGVKPGMTVGVLVERSLQLPAVLLGIWRAGAAYLPLDPSFPRARLEYMLRDSGAVLLLVDDSTEAKAPGEPPQLNIDASETVGTQIPAFAAGAEDTAYIIYTSGSTGVPKGVEIEHSALVNFILSMAERPGLESQDVLLAVTTLSFDIAALEIFLPLLQGATLVLATREEARDGQRLVELMKERGVTAMQATPATWRLVLAAKETYAGPLKALCGGEALPSDLARELLEAKFELWNMYGPTETTVWSSVAQITGTEKGILIGRPIHNTEFYVLGSQGELLPPGQSGELYIGGHGLARGYHQRPELNAERFPEISINGKEPERLYRTGDMACLLGNGEFRHLGRLDHQIKVRGFRIETGEIEAILREHPAVDQALVHFDGETLGAYLTPGAAETDPLLEKDRSEEWRRVWEENYREDRELSEPRFDVSGWVDSVNGQPIPREEMREWVDDTVQELLELKHERILELGVGSGLLLYPLLEQCWEYTGLDFSERSLNGIQAQLTPEERERVTLLKKDISELEELPPASYDLIILNSVAQYFPGTEYLKQIVAGAMKLLAPGGCFFLGDIRSLPLLDAFYTQVQHQRAQGVISPLELKRRRDRAVLQEEELALDPAFFTELRGDIPGLGDVLIRPRRGRARNEMNLFRYQVLLFAGESGTSGPAEQAKRIPFPLTLDWGKDQLTPQKVREILETQKPAGLLVQNAPHGHIQKINSLTKAKEKAKKNSASAVNPEDLLDWAPARYRSGISWARHETGGEMDLYFLPKNASEREYQIPTRPAGKKGSDPRWSNLYRELGGELRKLMEEKLPDYMRPTFYEVLREWPRLPNGKINRAALLKPAGTRALGPEFEPRSRTEQKLAEFWCELLGLEKVGREENFFELGGHSLLLMKLRDLLEVEFKRELPVTALFRLTSVRSQAEFISDGLDSSGGGPPERGAELFGESALVNPLNLELRNRRLKLKKVQLFSGVKS